MSSMDAVDKLTPRFQSVGEIVLTICDNVIHLRQTWNEAHPEGPRWPLVWWYYARRCALDLLKSLEEETPWQPEALDVCQAVIDQIEMVDLFLAWDQ